MKIKSLSFLLVLSFLAAPVCFANDFGTLKQAVTAARESLVTMLMSPAKRGADQQKLVADTANKVDELLHGMKAPAGKEAQFAELKEAWSAFHATRKAELVPAIVAGKQAEAEKIAAGVQKQRLKKVFDICDALSK